jgi:hypothetical protein
MDNKNILNLRRDVREMQVQHNRLTALCAVLLKSVKTLKTELYTLRSNPQQTSQQQQHQSTRQHHTPHQGFQQSPSRDLDEIHADEILRQLSSQH